MTARISLILGKARGHRPRLQFAQEPARLFLCNVTVVLLAAVITLATVTSYAQDSQRTVWDGVYNNEQAKRGEAAFVEACSNCHGRTLEGADMTPALTGGGFMANWDTLTLGDLFDRIRTSMPADRPGSLSRQEDADVVA